MPRPRTNLPHGLLLRHLYIIRSCAAKRTLFHLFTAHMVPFFSAHNGHTIYGEGSDVKTEIRECKTFRKIYEMKKAAIDETVGKSLLIRVQNVFDHKNAICITINFLHLLKGPLVPLCQFFGMTMIFALLLFLFLA